MAAKNNLKVENLLFALGAVVIFAEGYRLGQESQNIIIKLNVLIAAKALADTGAYNAHVERIIDGIIQQSVPVKGGYMYNSTTGALQYYNGSAWVPAPRFTAQFLAILKLVNHPGRLSLSLISSLPTPSLRTRAW